jgi:hypothetical protein
MKNAFFWNIKPKFIPHRKRLYVSATEPNLLILLIFEFFTAVTMKNVVFWNVALVKTENSEEHIASIIRVTHYFFSTLFGC